MYPLHPMYQQPTGGPQQQQPQFWGAMPQTPHQPIMMHPPMPYGFNQLQALSPQQPPTPLPASPTPPAVSLPPAPPPPPIAAGASTGKRTDGVSKGDRKEERNVHDPRGSLLEEITSGCGWTRPVLHDHVPDRLLIWQTCCCIRLMT